MATQKNSFENLGIQPTRLCTHKDNAAEINNAKMKELKGEARIYLASDNRPEYTEQMNKFLLVPDKLILKVGAQVCEDFSRYIYILCILFMLDDRWKGRGL